MYCGLLTLQKNANLRGFTINADIELTLICYIMITSDILGMFNKNYCLLSIVKLITITQCFQQLRNQIYKLA